MAATQEPSSTAPSTWPFAWASSPSRLSPLALWSRATGCVPKRFLRLVLTSALVCIGLIVYLGLKVRAEQRKPLSPDPIIHGSHVSEANKEHDYALASFPSSPAQNPPPGSTDGRQHPWLAAVISTAADAERRMLIRSTWMRLYRDVPFDGRFVVSNPGPQWTETVSIENRTFGDMIVLDNLYEDDMTAQTVKTLEFYKWLLNSGRRYEFVSKLDTDLFLNARSFWERYLLPRMFNETGRLTATVEQTIIGELYYSYQSDFAYPHGALYTATWDMVELLVSLQDRFHVVVGEDMALAILMLKDSSMANFVNFNGAEKFDYDDRDSRGDGTAWARNKTHPDAPKHALYGSDVIAVHQLKQKEQYVKVAECFDKDGIKAMPLPSGIDGRPPLRMRWYDFWFSIGWSSRYSAQIDRIPEAFWSTENGNWICDGMWNLGKTRTGFQ